MAFDESIAANHALSSVLTGDEADLTYLPRSSHGGPRFDHDLVAPSSVQAGDAQFLSASLDKSSLVAGKGMTPDGFEVPEGAITAASYNRPGGVLTSAITPPEQQIGSDIKAAAFKGAWTEEEDSTLKDMVMQFGERKWSTVAQALPGRIGKQCRERWINHLHPDIKKNDIWTEEDDKMLIGAHKYFGNHWSSIARFLPGRSENAIKNHWNATKRSLKSKRRLKKKKSEQQVAPGQLSALEEYIRGVYPTSESTTMLPPASPPLQNLAYNGLIGPKAELPHVPKMRMNFTAPNLVGLPLPQLPGMINDNIPPLPDLNVTCDSQEAYHVSNLMGATAPVPQVQMVTQDPHQACFNNWFPFVAYIPAWKMEHVAGPSFYTSGPSNYIDENNTYNEAGPSNTYGYGSKPAHDANNIVQMESREFMTPSTSEATMGYNRYE
ncbi:hypothetical protein HU200_026166 [Digitaria exilis]|uniref:Uncharacterized protein n=1 Tax=Digitaria exilis TaxID=1010633 RepID=A0A835C855_9POAL|nr:hypothetical protein HU200_026166 [Digitaria exilis]CAB3478887.1 unnamed protein product [Digitaria exilis]